MQDIWRSLLYVCMYCTLYTLSNTWGWGPTYFVKRKISKICGAENWWNSFQITGRYYTMQDQDSPLTRLSRLEYTDSRSKHSRQWTIWMSGKSRLEHTDSRSKHSRHWTIWMSEKSRLEHKDIRSKHSRQWTIWMSGKCYSSTVYTLQYMNVL